jgi:hypothetical protein
MMEQLKHNILHPPFFTFGNDSIGSRFCRAVGDLVQSYVPLSFDECPRKRSHSHSLNILAAIHGPYHALATQTEPSPYFLLCRQIFDRLSQKQWANKTEEAHFCHGREENFFFLLDWNLTGV